MISFPRCHLSCSYLLFGSAPDFELKLSVRMAVLMALNQPNDMTYANAVAYCQSYQTVGAAKGRWHLPNPTELIHMGKEQWNGTSNNKFAELNAKLATITDLGEQLKAGSFYFAHSSAQYKFKLDAYATPTTGGNGAVRCVLNF